jgi:hypothetical protein
MQKNTWERQPDEPALPINSPPQINHLQHPVQIACDSFLVDGNLDVGLKDQSCVFFDWRTHCGKPLIHWTMRHAKITQHYSRGNGSHCGNFAT